jgi:hypothetical protein
MGRFIPVLFLAPVLLVPAASGQELCPYCPSELVSVINGMYYYDCVCCADSSDLGVAISNRIHQLGCNPNSSSECLDPLGLGPMPPPVRQELVPVPADAGQAPALEQNAVLQRYVLNRPANFPLGSGGKEMDRPGSAERGTLHVLSSNYHVVDDAELKVYVTVQGTVTTKYFRVFTIAHRTLPQRTLRIGQELERGTPDTPGMTAEYTDSGARQWAVRILRDERVNPPVKQVDRTFYVLPRRP